LHESRIVLQDHAPRKALVEPFDQLSLVLILTQDITSSRPMDSHDGTLTLKDLG
jgi:hypothetical protein